MKKGRKEVLSKQDLKRCQRYCQDWIDLKYVLDEAVAVSSPVIDGLPSGSGTGDPVFAGYLIREIASKKLHIIHRAVNRNCPPEIKQHILRYLDDPSISLTELYAAGLDRSVSGTIFNKIIRAVFTDIYPHIDP